MSGPILGVTHCLVTTGSANWTILLETNIVSTVSQDPSVSISITMSSTPRGESTLEWLSWVRWHLPSFMLFQSTIPSAIVVAVTCHVMFSIKPKNLKVSWYSICRRLETRHGTALNESFDVKSTIDHHNPEPRPPGPRQPWSTDSYSSRQSWE